MRGWRQTQAWRASRIPGMEPDTQAHEQDEIISMGQHTRDCDTAASSEAGNGAGEGKSDKLKG